MERIDVADTPPHVPGNGAGAPAAAVPPGQHGSGDGGGIGPSRRLRRALRRGVESARDYPRVSVSAVLAIVSAIVGLLLLPSSKPAVAREPVLSAIEIETVPQVPTYLGFIARGPRLGQVVAAFQVPAHQAVKWQITFAASDRDRISWRNGVAQSFAPLGRNEVIGGTITGATDSYQALHHGYWSFSDSGAGLSFTAASKPIPIPGLVSLFLRTTGPDRFLVTAGYNATAVLPALFDLPPSPSVPFQSEIMVNAGGFENITGGPQIQKGTWWDWFQSGAVSETSATGINDLARQDSDNRTFEAAIAFGLTAAALATLAVEGVGAMAEEKKRVVKERDAATV